VLAHAADHHLVKSTTAIGGHAELKSPSDHQMITNVPTRDRTGQPEQMAKGEGGRIFRHPFPVVSIHC
jgi:hypothetical protein